VLKRELRKNLFDARDEVPRIVNAPSDYFFTSGGLKLYCAVYPARHSGGVPVLCLPGLTRNSKDFAELAEHIHVQHEVIAVDLRGRGRSAWDLDPAQYQLPTYVGDVMTLLDARRVPRVVIIGTSLGALIGMALAAVAPDRIAGVVLNDAGPEIDPAGARRIAGYVGRLPAVSTWTEAAAQSKSVYGEGLLGLTDQQWLDYARRSYRENAAGELVPDMDPKIAEAFRNSPTQPADLWPVFGQIGAVPMLVLRGAHSDLLSAATVERMMRENASVQSVTVPNRGHAPLLDEPECVSAIDAFLRRFARETT
jgi:pimeloyl-ACP methyl ester carboxylesterase